MRKDQAAALRFIAGAESNARTYARTFDRMFARGALSRIWDVDGNEYLDLLACAGALPLGHNHPYVMARVAEFLQSGHILQGLDIATPAELEFLERLMLTLPPAFARDARIQFCGPTGSDAVEAAIKLFKTVTGRRSVFAFHGAYHGMTLGALSLMGNLGPKTPVAGHSSDTHFFPYPNSHRCPFGVGGEQAEDLSLHYLDHVLHDPESGITKPALIILEAVQGEGGCIPASPRWLNQLRLRRRRRHARIPPGKRHPEPSPAKWRAPPGRTARLGRKVALPRGYSRQGLDGGRGDRRADRVRAAGKAAP